MKRILLEPRSSKTVSYFFFCLIILILHSLVQMLVIFTDDIGRTSSSLDYFRLLLLTYARFASMIILIGHNSIVFEF